MWCFNKKHAKKIRNGGRGAKITESAGISGVYNNIKQSWSLAFNQATASLEAALRNTSVKIVKWEETKRAGWASARRHNAGKTHFVMFLFFFTFHPQKRHVGGRWWFVTYAFSSFFFFEISSLPVFLWIDYAWRRRLRMNNCCGEMTKFLSLFIRVGNASASLNI